MEHLIGPLAQSAERGANNAKVVSSRLTIEKTHYGEIRGDFNSSTGGNNSPVQLLIFNKINKIDFHRGRSSKLSTSLLKFELVA